MTVYGIDLGTTYSGIASLDTTGRPTVLRTSDGTDEIPSAVYFPTTDAVVVGSIAKETAVIEPDLVIELIKRSMGQRITVSLHGKRFTPEEVSALILRKLADEAEAITGEDVVDVVVTVPAYFGIVEREATRRAGIIAGLNVIAVLSEPVAAALTYDTAPDGKTVLVYDLGGGTFDTTVIRYDGTDIVEVCTDGDSELGGVDWDERLADHLVSKFLDEHPNVGHPLDDPSTIQSIRSTVEGAKRQLSTVEEVTIRLIHDGRVTTSKITREEFEDMTRDLLDRTINVTKSVVAAALARGVDSIDEVLLVGGSSRMPAVTQRLSEEFECDPQLHDPDLAVAKGAAQFAFEETYRALRAEGDTDAARTMAQQSGLSPEDEERISVRRIHRVAGRGFGVRCFDGVQEYVAPLIRPNDSLPAAASLQFATGIDSQAAMELHIMEQITRAESMRISDNQHVASAPVPIPPGLPAGSIIDVTFTLSTTGLLQVDAAAAGSTDPVRLQVQIGQVSEEDIETSRQRIAAIDVS